MKFNDRPDNPRKLCHRVEDPPSIKRKKTLRHTPATSAQTGTMLGYSRTQSAEELLAHHRQLKASYPADKQAELDWAYGWIKDRPFMTAIDAPTKEAWQWLRTAMPHPPKRVIEHFSAQSRTMPPLQSHLVPLRALKKPTCRICHEALANDIVETVKFATLLCNCGTKMVHTHCVETYAKQCCLCKQYFIVTMLHANVRSMIGVCRGPSQTVPDSQSRSDSNGTKTK